jgi:FlaA1/EpsC-like NDP-sugar epimerase/lipopolysaccharide/colanic/teichoic acid biosynthesis glycosyltransferase
MLKRALDICLAVLGLMVLLPFLPVLAVLLKLDSKGPVLYLCDRLGKDGKPFKMYKFRTMYHTLGALGPSICPQGDPRVTPLGRFLRRTKLNELPQLINILKGDMSFVGPRPEAPDLARLYPAPARVIFAVTPGLVGPSQILGRNEEEWYPPAVDPQQYYLDVILPKKLPLDLEYVHQSSALTDLKYLFLGIKETLFKVLNWNLVLQNRSQIYLLLVDLVLSLGSFVLAYVLKFADFSEGVNAASVLRLLPVVILVRLPCFAYCGLYGSLIRYLSFHDLIGVVQAVSASSLLLIGWTVLFNVPPVPRTVFLIDWLCLILLLSSLRGVLRLSHDWRATHRDDRGRRVLIFGAGDAGVLAYQSLMAERERAFDVVGFLDDDPAKRHKTLYGKKVLGNRFTMGAVVKLYQIHEVFLALPSAPSSELMQIVQACQQVGVPYRIFPTLKHPAVLQDVPPRWRDVALGELLETPRIELHAAVVRDLLRGKNVLVTGTHGALGIELCRQLLGFAPHKLVILERSEAYLAELMAHLLNTSSADCLVPVLCPWTGHNASAEVFQQYQPHIVFHSPARKYLPLYNVQMTSAVPALPLHTFALAQQAAMGGCAYFVLVSSVEAAKRGNPIADDLRAVEIGLSILFASHRTKLVTLRLGDVLENRGGIVAMLEEQIAHGETVMLPHHNATGAFLSKHDAARFILEALALADTAPHEAGIFICTQQGAIPLLEVARKLALRYGLHLEADLPVKFVEDASPAGNAETCGASSNGSAPVPTANASIGLLRDDSLPYSHEMIKEMHHFLKLQEDGLEQAIWERLSHQLLLQERSALRL